MTSETNRKVLIVGAGVGGLVLAQILRDNKIPFEIFERDESQSQRSQGWSVSLAEALPVLRQYLPADLGNIETLGASYAAGYLDDVSLWDSVSKTVVNRYGGQAADTPGWVMRPARPKMRAFLWPHVNVQSGKKFTHYTEDEENDTVTAHFADGTHATGSILVGADGARSHVREQLLGDPVTGPKDLLTLSKYQQVPSASVYLSPAEYAEIRKITTSTIVAPGHGTWFALGIQDSQPDGSAKAFWAMAYYNEDPAAEAAWLRASSQKSKLDKAKKLVAETELPEIVKEIANRTRAEDVFDQAVIFQEFVPPKRLPRGRVTLLGDAMHAMVPLRGAGANTAIRNAAELAKTVVKYWETGAGTEKILREFESVALPRGREMVLASRAAGESGRKGDGNWSKIIMGDRHSTLGKSAAAAAAA